MKKINRYVVLAVTLSFSVSALGSGYTSVKCVSISKSVACPCSTCNMNHSSNPFITSLLKNSNVEMQCHKIKKIKSGDISFTQNKKDGMYHIRFGNTVEVFNSPLVQNTSHRYLKYFDELYLLYHSIVI